MICRNYKIDMLNWLVSNSVLNKHACYVALSFSKPTLIAQGYQQGYFAFDEPQAAAGYSRYAFTPTIDSDDPSQLNVIAKNNSTIYFDEATADWTGPEGATRIPYYVLCASNTIGEVGFAYGEILDDYGNPTSIEVKEGQLPIIRKDKLQVSLNETLPVRYELSYIFPTGCPYVETTTTDLYAIPALKTYAPYEYEDNTYTFEGWYYDSGYNDPVTAGDPLDSDCIIYAKFEIAQ